MANDHDLPEPKTLGEMVAEHHEYLSRKRSDPKWGHWRFEVATLTLIHDRTDYYIGLVECLRPADVLGWIVQVKKKAWCSSEELADLIRALDDLLTIQVTYCAYPDGKVDVPSILRGNGFLGPQP